MTANDQVFIFDTTLRDGEQSPGASMSLEEKVRIAKALERLNVDVIEAGFAAASKGDLQSVEAVAQAISNTRVCSLARAMRTDIEAAAEALKSAKYPRIHTFIATSPIHMQHKLKMTEAEVIERAAQAIKLARQYTDDVEFSPEDAGRSDFDFLCKVIDAAIKAGAKTINIADTVGYNIPGQFGHLFKRLIETVENADTVVFSAHCHNDLGLAVANALAAVENGARQVECTINGLGERAGNAALEEVVMALKVRKDLLHCDTRVNPQELLTCSRLVSGITGFPVQPNKAIVGVNAFAHESGIHQDGVIKHRETYEIMKAEDVGWKANRMVLGKHSGRNAFRARLAELGIELSSNTEFDDAFERFKGLADKKHDVYDEDLQAIVSDTQKSIKEIIRLESIQIDAATAEAPTATVALSVQNKSYKVSSTGDGMVDALFSAIEKVVQSGASLELFTVNAITGGTDSQGGVTVRLEKNGRLVNGRGSDTDIVFASAKAYINGLNQLLDESHAVHPQVSL